MKKTEFAIVDIETTGANASGSRITEIAIIIHDGTRVIDRFESLVNPQEEIPIPIFALTGITNEMVSKAPIFEDLAQKIWEMLSNRIFVAHNVNFDYSFVRHQLEQAGYNWKASKLCTVRMARAIRPGLRSYSLGKLCQELGIPLESRHRAGGDADATVKLFNRLLQWDQNAEIEKMLSKMSVDQRLPPNLPVEDFDRLPEKPGVYYFYNQLRQVLYVGKAINIKKRVSSHFSGHKIGSQRQNFMRDIYGISFEVCGTELMALILESSEIKKCWPIYNRALKRFEPKYGLYQYEARNGYQYLAIGKLNKFQNCIEYFNNIQKGINTLLSLKQQFEIDYRFCKIAVPSLAEKVPQSDFSDLPQVEIHNEKIEQALAFLLSNRSSYAIIDKGRTSGEHGCIWVEKGHFYGMGYFPSDIGFTDMDQIKDYMKPYKSNQYIMNLIQVHIQKHPNKVIFSNQHRQ